jgi:ketosteroid isomerase-like protein
LAAGPLAEQKALVDRLFDAFNRGDFEEALDYVHPDAEVRLAVEPMEPVEGSRQEVHGRDGLRKFWELLDDSWEEIRVEIKDFAKGADDRLISFETWTVHGAQGIVVDTELVCVYGFRDGLIKSCDSFRDRKDALAEFGLDG